jgi:YhcH/YjgK/YiaL family protein
MFYCNRKDACRYDYHNELFQKAYAWLDQIDPETIAKGDYVIVEGKVIAHVNEPVTKPYEQCIYESHAEHFDIHYMIHGQEAVAVAPVQDLVQNGANAANDNLFYQAPSQHGTVLLTEGQMLILDPEDGHATCVAVGKEAQIKKIVIKVSIK